LLVADVFLNNASLAINLSYSYIDDGFMQEWKSTPLIKLSNWADTSLQDISGPGSESEGIGYRRTIQRRIQRQYSL
jgi:hypothetical protein